MKKMRNAGLILVLIAAALLSGCATNINPPATAPQPPKAKFANFDEVYLVDLSVAPAYASSGANQKAAKKLQELLNSKMPQAFTNLKNVSSASSVNVSDGKKALVIQPEVEQMKFIGGMARFWVGAMAGSSAVLMKVTYTDKSNNEVIASPEFYQKANAYTGAWSYGATDNLMLDRVIEDIRNYSIVNR